MSTRAVYSFYGSFPVVHVYKHYSNYPYMGVRFIHNALDYAWKLPRYENDEFSGAFVGANKDKRRSDIDGGDIRLISGGLQPWEFSSDSEYWYKIRREKSGLDLNIEIYEANWLNGTNRNKIIWHGSLTNALKDFPIEKIA